MSASLVFVLSMRLASLPLCLLLTLLAGMIVTTAVSAPSQVISTAPDFTMSASPDSLSIPAGALGTSTITLVSVDGFNGSVSLSAPSPLCPNPQCTTWEISPSNVAVAPNSTGTATLTVFAGGEGAAGNITVYGNSGGLSHSVSVAFKVVSSGTSPDFAMSANPKMLTIVQGSAGKSLIILTSINGFRGNVSLTTSPPPLCVSCPGWSVNPSSVTLSPGGTAVSTLNFYTTTGSPASTWVVSVTGTSGRLSHSVNVAFTIVPSGSTSDFAMTANPNSLTIPAGSSGTSTIVVTSLNGFNGTVNLYTSPLPSALVPNVAIGR